MAQKKRFNKTLLTGLIQAQQKVTLHDTEVSGLKFTVGSKRSTFQFEKRISGRKGSPITITIGAFPAISIDEARQEARKLANLCEKGLDPRQVKQQQAGDCSTQKVLVAEALDKFFAVKAGLSPRTLAKYREEVRNHFPTAWKKQCLTAITPEMLVEQFHEIRKTARERCFEFLKVFNNIWTTCTPLFLDGHNQRILKENPVPLARQMLQHIKKDQPQRIIIPAAHLGKFVVTVEVWAAETERNLTASPLISRFCHLVLLCLFTGMRGIEAKNLRWEYIDLKQEVISLPGRVADEKFGFQGTKNKRDHLIPLSSAALELFQKLQHQRNTVSPFVFPSASSLHKPMTQYGALAKQLSERLQMPFAVHACRRTFASIADEVGLDFLKVKRSLNHAFEGGVTGGYINPGFNPAKRRVHFQMVCDYIWRCKAEYLGQRKRAEEGFDQLEALKKIERYALEVGLSLEEALQLQQEHNAANAA